MHLIMILGMALDNKLHSSFMHMYM